MKRLLPFLFCLLLFPAFYTVAQELPEPDTANGTEADQSFVNDGDEGQDDLVSAPEAKKEIDYIELDIRTSSLLELAAWCRELGLSEGGSRDDLAYRLRNYYNISSARAASSDQRIITIESAKTTEYFTLEVVDEEYARLKGDVILSLKEGNAVHRIKAWEILFNRTRNVITATGKVEYVKEDGDSIETFKGESITVNLDNWSSIFMDGISEKGREGVASAYRFAGTVISRNSEEVTVLTGAEITNAANEEAFWSLHASKLWLLPGNDWAVLNAVLKVGNIPLLYIPFFLYPADEIIFHPVLGYRNREGTYLQTTTYILGRPKAAAVTENSITDIFGGASENMEKKREGVFLRTTGEKISSSSDTMLSVLFDAYVNLGFYLGAELALPRKGAFGGTNLSAGVGLTRDVYSQYNVYTPFVNYRGDDNWNTGMLFSLEVPIRYRLKWDGSFQLGNGSFSWSIPFYSDPYVDRDFMDRTEALDWLSMLREGASASSELASDTYLSSYNWTLSGSYTPRLPSLAPYVNSISFQTISSSLSFNSRYTSSAYYNDSSSPPNPGRSFFFPKTLNMFSISASMSGAPYTYGSSSTTTGAQQGGEAPGDSLLPDLPRSPWDFPSTELEGAGADAQTTNQWASSTAGGQNPLQDAYSFTPAILNQSFNLPSSGGGPQVAVNYRLTPSIATDVNFDSDNWERAEDATWDVSTIMSRIRTTGELGLNVTQPRGGVYSGSFTMSGTGSWQDYMLLNEEAAEFTTSGATDDAKVKAARDRAYKETYFTSNWNFNTTVKPFLQSAVWGNSSLQYNVNGIFAKTNVDTSGDDPEWDWVMGKWNNSDVTTHQISANLAANVMDHNQNLSVYFVLPPKDPVVSATATFNAWISRTSVNGRIQYPWDEEQRKIDPLTITEALTLGTLGSFQQTVIIDPEEEEVTTFTTSLVLSAFSASFSARYMQPYSFTKSSGWTASGDSSLQLERFQLNFRKDFVKKELWANRLSFSIGLNTSLGLDLQRYTNSNLIFNLVAKLQVANFLDLSFSTSSENKVMYKYFQTLKIPFFYLNEDLYPGQTTNFFEDLWYSFRFDNTDLRRKSGFKLKSMDISLTHHLGDWNAVLTASLQPYLDRASATYKFSNDISFLVQWVPIGEIKSQIDYIEEVLTVK